MMDGREDVVSYSRGLESAIQQIRLHFLRSELMLAQSFCTAAETSTRMGNVGNARELLEIIRRAAISARHNLIEADTTVMPEHLVTELGLLEERLRHLERYLANVAPQ